MSIQGIEIAVKIEREHDSSKLSHENGVYAAIAGGSSISPVHWYGKEGQHEVIVLDHLETSLDNLISGQQVDHGRIFQYASQMVCPSRK